MQSFLVFMEIIFSQTKNKHWAFVASHTCTVEPMCSKAKIVHTLAYLAKLFSSATNNILLQGA